MSNTPTNVDIRVDETTHIMTIKVDLTQRHGTSSTGKTVVVGTTHGHQTIYHDKIKYFVNLNVNCK